MALVVASFQVRSFVCSYVVSGQHAGKAMAVLFKDAVTLASASADNTYYESSFAGLVYPQRGGEAAAASAAR